MPKTNGRFAEELVCLAKRHHEQIVALKRILHTVETFDPNVALELLATARRIVTFHCEPTDATGPAQQELGLMDAETPAN